MSTNSTDYFDLMTPHWSNQMAKQYNKDMKEDKSKIKKGMRVKETNTTSTGVVTRKHEVMENAWWVLWDYEKQEFWLNEDEMTVIDENTNKVASKLVDNNPKTLVALSKPRMSDVPPVALFALGAAMSDGANKYGRYNWRDTSATVSVFYDAINRHLTDYYNGENYAHDSKVHHLGHIMASCAILLDAELHGSIVDDRDKRKSISISRNPTWKQE